MSLQLGILVSGNGSNLQAIIDAIASGVLNAKIKVVISDNAKAFAKERAEKAGIPFIVFEKKNFESKSLFEKSIVSELKNAGVNWVVLAGFMRILTSDFLKEFPNQVLNIHPSLLPSFPGLHAIEQAWKHKVKVTGCTVHLVDEGCDTGPILGQSVVEIEDQDTLESLSEKIHAAEHKLYVKILQKLAVVK